MHEVAGQARALATKRSSMAAEDLAASEVVAQESDAETADGGEVKGSKTIGLERTTTDNSIRNVKQRLTDQYNHLSEELSKCQQKSTYLGRGLARCFFDGHARHRD